MMLEERRNNQRYKVYQGISNGKELVGYSLDLSKSGIKMMLDKRLVNHQSVFYMALNSTKEPIKFECIRVWEKELSSHINLIVAGYKFSEFPIDLHSELEQITNKPQNHPQAI